MWFHRTSYNLDVYIYILSTNLLEESVFIISSVAEISAGLGVNITVCALCELEQ